MKKRLLHYLPLCFIVALVLSYANPVQAENIIFYEDFNSCDMGTWVSNSASADNTDFEIGIPGNPEAMGSSIDGSCFAYFDDHIMGQNNALTTNVGLLSPVFDGSDYATLTLEFDLHYRSDEVLNDYLNVYVYAGGTNNVAPVATYRDLSVIGNLYSDFAHQTIDISAYRGTDMVIYMEYNDGGGQSYWVGIDNVKVTASASISCANADAVTIGEICQQAVNAKDIFEGSAPTCEADTYDAAVWYTFTPTSDAVTIKSQATFNDVLSVFSGSCGSLIEIACINDDLYGFNGETLALNGLIAGTSYTLRISGIPETFGGSAGAFCLLIENGMPTNTPPVPVNNICANATNINVDGACVSGTNLNASLNGPLPTLNTRSTNDIWYSFTATSENIVINSNADFADVITLFNGNCGSLAEIAGNDFGRTLNVSDLTIGETYYVQITSFFQSIHGNVCVEVNTVSNAPTNDLCVDATNVTIGAACTLGNNELATLGDYNPSCDIKPTASIWFSFVAPISGQVSINTGADFIHVLSLYSGVCSDLSELNCVYNPYKCNDPTSFGALTPGNTYYLQVSSAENPFGYVYGDVCIKINEGGGSPVKATLNVVLQGAYDATTGMMKTALVDNALIPTEQPYHAAPWNYNGAECVAIMGSSVVDWVLVELRDANDPNMIVATKAALLLNDGSVVDEGRDGVNFLNVTTNDSYYVVVRHRNHLAVISNAPITLPNVDLIDFTQANAVMGADQLIDVSSDGLYALKAGDIDANGVITVQDYNLYTNEASMLNVYSNSDCNLDKTITVADYNIYQANASAIGVQLIRY